MENRESRTPVLNGVTALGPINKTGFAAVTSLGGCIRAGASARARALAAVYPCKFSYYRDALLAGCR